MRAEPGQTVLVAELIVEYEEGEILGAFSTLSKAKKVCREHRDDTFTGMGGRNMDFNKHPRASKSWLWNLHSHGITYTIWETTIQ